MFLMIFVERKFWILTFKVGYTFLLDTLENIRNYCLLKTPNFMFLVSAVVFVIWYDEVSFIKYGSFLKKCDCILTMIILNLLYQKACPRYFLFFNQMIDSHLKTQNNASYFILKKSSFCSYDFQLFVFPSFHLFIPVSNCFRG